MKHIGLSALLAMAVISGCEKNYDDQVRDIENFFAKNKTGTSADYMLVKNGAFGLDKVAVIFGFMDDQAFCREIAELYMQRYKGVQYACIPMNE